MKKKATLFAIISGACFLLFWFLEFAVFRPIVYDYPFVQRLIEPKWLITYIPLVVFSVMLILRKKNPVMFGSWCVFAAFSIMNCIRKLIMYLEDGFYRSTTNYIISYFFRILYLVSIAVVLLFICIPKLKLAVEKLSNFWFAPIILLSGGWLFYSIRSLLMIRRDLEFLIYSISSSRFEPYLLSFLYYPLTLIEVAAVVFFCLWLWYDWGKPKWTKKAPVVAEAAPVLSVADQLLHYKELLDMGAITQEEFDAKKKELLS